MQVILINAFLLESGFLLVELHVAFFQNSKMSF
jgi:hypothetical protein